MHSILNLTHTAGLATRLKSTLFVSRDQHSLSESIFAYRNTPAPCARRLKFAHVHLLLRTSSRQILTCLGCCNVTRGRKSLSSMMADGNMIMWPWRADCSRLSCMLLNSFP